MLDLSDENWKIILTNISIKKMNLNEILNCYRMRITFLFIIIFLNDELI